MNLTYLSKLFIKLSSNKKYFVGTCINSFDENGVCIINDLPWNNVSDFAYAEENATQISKHEFLQNIEPNQPIIKSLLKKHIIFTQYENIIFAYDYIKDIHYFFI